ncbi:MAG: aconitase X catalytic domain-containing protein [Thermodesulfobacteriota bacterium]|jgi:predicted aconitase
MKIKLGSYEEDILRGKKGEAAKLALEIVVKLAEAFGVEELVEISSVQAMAHYGSLHDAGLELMEKLAGLGGKCCVPTTQDPASISFKCWERLGIPKEYAEKQMELARAIQELGELPTWSCTPYYIGNIPRFGQNIAWAESSAVSFANSVIGARTNRTPAGLAICAALTARMPKAGLYLDENRVATVKLVIDAGNLSDLDYNTIGIILGKIAGTRISALFGIPSNVTNDNLKYLGASAASSGSVALYHVIGVTPEAMMKDPFAGKAPEEEIIITRRYILEAEKSLTTSHAGEVDLVVVGCPHYSINEIVSVTKLFKGKKMKKSKEFWIYTTLEAENLAKRMGLLNILEDAGVKILAQNCLVISPLFGGYKTLMTDSGKFASYLPSEHGIELIYGSTVDCVKAVIT